ncbi:MAG: hypothetical protein KTR25_20605 [Myxococcales bacterium]|nr:hypothetical protein [Myxococcales bacterium]
MYLRTSELFGQAAVHTKPAGVALKVGFLAVSLLLSACEDVDVGRCCQVLRPESQTRVPEADQSERARIALDPGFDCDSLICVDFFQNNQDQQAYCTTPCLSDEDCPDDFICRNVLTSDPGPNANIRPSDKFCVKEQFVCEE